MTIQELYARIDGNYEAVRRILPMDALIGKFIIRLLSDDSCDRLMKAYSENDFGGMFEAAHSMKGVYANLGLLDLSAMASAVAEEFRPGKERKMTESELSELMGSLKEKFDSSMASIREFEAGQG